MHNTFSVTEEVDINVLILPKEKLRGSKLK